MNTTPRANRLHIAIFGKRNSGKSSLINAITNQEIALVADVAGTTTDPVYKSMELLPIGPVVIIDTAGFDDVGDLGAKRVYKTYEVLRKTDLAIVVINAKDGVTDKEINFINEVKKRKIGIVCVINKIDEYNVSEEYINKLKKELQIPVIAVSARQKIGIEELKNLIPSSIEQEKEKCIVSDLINEGDIVVLVTPIDSAAPKGRMILPQQQTIRDVIDKNAIAVVTKENTLEETLEKLKGKVSLVVTDSQAFKKVSEIVPRDIPLTSFSILFARYKGELDQLIDGINALYNLKEGDTVLIAEGCTHHRQIEDIGKVKIPKWIKQTVGEGINYEWSSGTTIPDDIKKYSLIIHCGGCMLNSKEMKYRLNYAKENNVPITNYGILIAKVHGILDRVLEPIPGITNILDNKK